MNGIIAAAFWTSALLDPNYSLLDGFESQSLNSSQAVSISVVQFQMENIGTEISISRSEPTSYGPLQPIYSASITNKGGSWAGLGFYNEIETSKPFSLGFSFMPGLYAYGKDVDLGGWLMFRSGIHFNFDISTLWRLSLVYDHRSSGDIWKYNPGLETVQLRLEKRL